MPKLAKHCAWITLLMLGACAARASDNDVAVVEALRAAWLNGVPIPRVSAIFPGDMVQTKDEFADINAFGSKVVIGKDSLITYRTNAVELERGGISVGTAKGLATQIEGLSIRPVATNWTEFQVTNSNGTVHVIASKGDVILADEKGTMTLSSGQEATREVPQRKRKKRAAGAPPAGQGSMMDSKAALVIGGAAVIGVPLWVLCRSDDPISPDTPRGGCL